MKHIFHSFMFIDAPLVFVEEYRNVFIFNVVSSRSCHLLDYDGAIINFSTRWGHIQMKSMRTVYSHVKRAISQQTVKKNKKQESVGLYVLWGFFGSFSFF